MFWTSYNPKEPCLGDLPCGDILGHHPGKRYDILLALFLFLDFVGFSGFAAAAPAAAAAPQRLPRRAAHDRPPLV